MLYQIVPFDLEMLVGATFLDSIGFFHIRLEHFLAFKMTVFLIFLKEFAVIAVLNC
jgi:hypothetical protein